MVWEDFRPKVKEEFIQAGIPWLDNISRAEYHKLLFQSFFVSSPIGTDISSIHAHSRRLVFFFFSGNGIDCFRHYEALLSGAIPIVWKSEAVINPMLGHCGNILLVDRDDYGFIKDLSIALYDKMMSKVASNSTADCRKLALAQYWFDKFEKDRAKYRLLT